jgi:hypothetical protein
LAGYGRGTWERNEGSIERSAKEGKICLRSMRLRIDWLGATDLQKGVKTNSLSEIGQLEKRGMIRLAIYRIPTSRTHLVG